MIDQPKNLIYVCWVFFLFFPFTTSLAFQTATAHHLTTRLAFQTSTAHHPEALIQSIQNDPDAGKKVYLEFCAVCHDPEPQIPLGAPRLGVSEDWSHRQNLEALFNSVSEGMGAMPARGGCFECTDDLLRAAIQYMLSN